MTRIVTLVLTGIALATIGAANPRDQAQIDHMLAGKTPGPPRDCLSQFDSQSSSTHDGVVLFRVNSKLVYRNDMDGCELLHEDDILSTHLYGSGNLCRGDIATIIDRTGRYEKGACSYGKFVPYRAPVSGGTR